MFSPSRWPVEGDDVAAFFVAGAAEDVDVAGLPHHDVHDPAAQFGDVFLFHADVEQADHALLGVEDRLVGGQVPRVDDERPADERLASKRGAE